MTNPNVPNRVNRSMNADLRRGAVDGRIRFNRPDTANAEATGIEARERALHPSWYGTLGLPENANAVIAAALPAAVPPQHPVRLPHGHVGYDLDDVGGPL
jgi:hypothetical protein